MGAQIKLGDIVIDVVKKDIKNVHLSVYPPAGAVRISAPLRMSTDTIRVFAIAKLGWIRQAQRKLQEQERETPREYLDRESHYVWGRRYLLQGIETNAPPRVELKHNKMLLCVRPGASQETKRAAVQAWYRDQLKQAVAPLIDKWQAILGVQVARFVIQRMKTRWGSCSPASGSIRLNLELAKKPHACLEYIIVHEMMHLLEPTHNSRYVALMDHYMPQWPRHRDALNRLPVRHEQWRY